MTEQNNSANIKLSVIIASHNARRSVAECLKSVETQSLQRFEKIEIIVVDNSTDETAMIIIKNFPQVTLIQASENKLIPELWGIGLEAAGGELAALTTSHFVPAENWIEQIIKIHKTDCAGAGGAIENDSQSNLVSWAVYFCRYSAYALPFVQKEVGDFAADNACYKSEAIKRVAASSLSDGFWETTIHRQMSAIGMKLIITPEIIVKHKDSFTFSEFMSQRFKHGIQFGKARSRELSSGKRILMIICSPLIPFIYLFRITRRVIDKQKNIDKYFCALPLMFLFLLAWTAGELGGYLSGKVGKP